MRAGADEQRKDARSSVPAFCFAQTAAQSAEVIARGGQPGRWARVLPGGPPGAGLTTPAFSVQKNKIFSGDFVSFSRKNGGFLSP